MQILFVLWDAFMQKGIEDGFYRLSEKMDLSYDSFFYRITDWEQDENLRVQLNQKLVAKKYDAVFTVNFCPVISEVCNSNNIKYISWVYDCPLHIKDDKTLYNMCNYIYFFDYAQMCHYKSKGVTGARHCILAADTYNFDKINPTNAEREKYSCDISLVGKLYHSDYEYLCAPLNQYQRGYLEGIIEAQSKVYGGYFLGELITKELLEDLNISYQSTVKEEIKPVKKEEVEFALNTEITGRERFLALALLENRYNVHIHTLDVDKRLQKAKFCGYVDYYSQMPKVFKCSKINLNISLKAIQTGIPLRVFDVLASKGFLLTNYQEEIANNFQDGVDLVMYEDVKDMIAKASYYLSHEEERLSIAKNGYNKVKKAFTFEKQLESIINESIISGV